VRRAAPRWLVAVVALCGAGVAAARPPIVAYLEVGASEGSSLGGHAALRVGDAVFHFQHRAPGLLVLERTDPGSFRWQYGTVQNRTIRSVRLALPDAIAERLRADLGVRYLAQRQHLGVRDALARDRDLLASLASGDRLGMGVAVRGAAAFFRDGERLDESGVGAASGGAIRAAIASLDVACVPALPTRIVPGVPVETDALVADRERELLERLVALDVLATRRHVLPERLVRVPGALPLTPTERGTLEAFGARLRAAARRLPGSERPDWGLALLVSVARLDAIDASLAADAIVVVGAPGTPGAPLATAHADDRAFVAELRAGARRALGTVRSHTIAAGPLTEQGWARVEQAAMRVIALGAGDRPPGDAPRAAPMDATPSASVSLRGLPRPTASRRRARRGLAAVESAIRRWDDALGEAYAYDLFERNCVTALVDALAAAGVPGVTRQALGSVGFVPRVSFARIAASASAGRVEALPSFRRRRLARMCAREPPWVVRLREDNVLTSTLRRATDDQPAFVFFTDDTVLPRPAYGAVNLAVAAVQAGAGLLAAPLDRAALLRRGLRGALASVPELAFLSVRTGRFRYDRDAVAADP
jgi:hypothetical protein